MKRTASVVLNDSLLLLTAIIWGMAFVAQRMGMEHVGPFTYNAVRFGIGSVTLLPLIAFRSRSARPAEAADTPPAAPAEPAARMSAIVAGLIAGGVLFFGASLQQVGLLTTTAGKAGFITGLYVVLVPLFGLAVRQRAGWSAWVGAGLSVAGLFLLSVTDTFAIQRGDLLVLIGAFFWAGHVQVVGWLSRRTDPIRLSSVQFAVCSLASLLIALVFEHPTLDGIYAAAWPILYGGFMSVGVAFTLQVVAQRHAPPAHAAILLSFETVVAALGGALLLGERLAPRGIAGCAIIFAGMLVCQTPVIMVSLAGVRRRV
jgi:drug/metabolite transporter (DMT)-like permease